MVQVFQEVVDRIKYEKSSEKTVVEEFYSEFCCKNVNVYLKKIE